MKDLFDSYNGKIYTKSMSNASFKPGVNTFKNDSLNTYVSKIMIPSYYDFSNVTRMLAYANIHYIDDKTFEKEDFMFSKVNGYMFSPGSLTNEKVKAIQNVVELYRNTGNNSNYISSTNGSGIYVDNSEKAYKINSIILKDFDRNKLFSIKKAFSSSISVTIIDDNDIATYSYGDGSTFNYINKSNRFTSKVVNGDMPLSSKYYTKNSIVFELFNNNNDSIAKFEVPISKNIQTGFELNVDISHSGCTMYIMLNGKIEYQEIFNDISFDRCEDITKINYAIYNNMHYVYDTSSGFILPNINIYHTSSSENLTVTYDYIETKLDENNKEYYVSNMENLLKEPDTYNFNSGNGRYVMDNSANESDYNSSMNHLKDGRLKDFTYNGIYNYNFKNSPSYYPDYIAGKLVNDVTFKGVPDSFMKGECTGYTLDYEYTGSVRTKTRLPHIHKEYILNDTNSSFEYGFTINRDTSNPTFKCTKKVNLNKFSREYAKSVCKNEEFMYAEIDGVLVHLTKCHIDNNVAILESSNIGLNTSQADMYKSCVCEFNSIKNGVIFLTYKSSIGINSISVKESIVDHILNYYPTIGGLTLTRELLDKVCLCNIEDKYIYPYPDIYRNSKYIMYVSSIKMPETSNSSYASQKIRYMAFRINKTNFNVDLIPLSQKAYNNNLSKCIYKNNRNELVAVSEYSGTSDGKDNDLTMTSFMNSNFDMYCCKTALFKNTATGENIATNKEYFKCEGIPINYNKVQECSSLLGKWNNAIYDAIYLTALKPIDKSTYDLAVKDICIFGNNYTKLPGYTSTMKEKIDKIQELPDATNFIYESSPVGSYDVTAYTDKLFPIKRIESEQIIRINIFGNDKIIKYNPSAADKIKFKFNGSKLDVLVNGIVNDSIPTTVKSTDVFTYMIFNSNETIVYDMVEEKIEISYPHSRMVRINSYNCTILSSKFKDVNNHVDVYEKGDLGISNHKTRNGFTSYSLLETTKVEEPSAGGGFILRHNNSIDSQGYYISSEHSELNNNNFDVECLFKVMAHNNITSPSSTFWPSGKTKTLIPMSHTDFLNTNTIDSYNAIVFIVNKIRYFINIKNVLPNIYNKIKISIRDNSIDVLINDIPINKDLVIKVSDASMYNNSGFYLTGSGEFEYKGSDITTFHRSDVFVRNVKMKFLNDKNVFANKYSLDKSFDELKDIIFTLDSVTKDTNRPPHVYGLPVKSLYYSIDTYKDVSANYLKQYIEEFTGNSISSPYVKSRSISCENLKYLLDDSNKNYSVLNTMQSDLIIPSCYEFNSTLSNNSIMIGTFSMLFKNDINIDLTTYKNKSTILKMCLTINNTRVDIDMNDAICNININMDQVIVTINGVMNVYTFTECSIYNILNVSFVYNDTFYIGRFEVSGHLDIKEHCDKKLINTYKSSENALANLKSDSYFELDRNVTTKVSECNVINPYLNGDIISGAYSHRVVAHIGTIYKCKSTTTCDAGIVYDVPRVYPSISTTMFGVLVHLGGSVKLTLNVKDGSAIKTFLSVPLSDISNTYTVQMYLIEDDSMSKVYLNNANKDSNCKVIIYKGNEVFHEEVIKNPYGYTNYPTFCVSNESGVASEFEVEVATSMDYKSIKGTWREYLDNPILYNVPKVYDKTLELFTMIRYSDDVVLTNKHKTNMLDDIKDMFSCFKDYDIDVSVNVLLVGDTITKLRDTSYTVEEYGDLFTALCDVNIYTKPSVITPIADVKAFIGSEYVYEFSNRTGGRSTTHYGFTDITTMDIVKDFISKNNTIQMQKLRGTGNTCFTGNKQYFETHLREHIEKDFRNKNVVSVFVDRNRNFDIDKIRRDLLEIANTLEVGDFFVINSIQYDSTSFNEVKYSKNIFNEYIKQGVIDYITSMDINSMLTPRTDTYYSSECRLYQSLDFITNKLIKYNSTFTTKRLNIKHFYIGNISSNLLVDNSAVYLQSADISTLLTKMTGYGYNDSKDNIDNDNACQIMTTVSILNHNTSKEDFDTVKNMLYKNNIYVYGEEDNRVFIDQDRLYKYSRAKTYSVALRCFNNDFTNNQAFAVYHTKTVNNTVGFYSGSFIAYKENPNDECVVTINAYHRRIDVFITTEPSFYTFNIINYLASNEKPQIQVTRQPLSTISNANTVVAADIFVYDRQMFRSQDLSNRRCQLSLTSLVKSGAMIIDQVEITYKYKKPPVNIDHGIGGGTIFWPDGSWGGIIGGGSGGSGSWWPSYPGIGGGGGTGGIPGGGNGNTGSGGGGTGVKPIPPGGGGSLPTLPDMGGQLPPPKPNQCVNDYLANIILEKAQEQFTQAQWDSIIAEHGSIQKWILFVSQNDMWEFVDEDGNVLEVVFNEELQCDVVVIPEKPSEEYATKVICSDSKIFTLFNPAKDKYVGILKDIVTPNILIDEDIKKTIAFGYNYSIKGYTSSILDIYSKDLSLKHYNGNLLVTGWNDDCTFEGSMSKHISMTKLDGKIVIAERNDLPPSEIVNRKGESTICNIMAIPYNVTIDDKTSGIVIENVKDNMILANAEFIDNEVIVNKRYIFTNANSSIEVDLNDIVNTSGNYVFNIFVENTNGIVTVNGATSIVIDTRVDNPIITIESKPREVYVPWRAESPEINSFVNGNPPLQFDKDGYKESVEAIYNIKIPNRYKNLSITVRVIDNINIQYNFDYSGAKVTNTFNDVVRFLSTVLSPLELNEVWNSPSIISDIRSVTTPNVFFDKMTIYNPNYMAPPNTILKNIRVVVKTDNPNLFVLNSPMKPSFIGSGEFKEIDVELKYKKGATSKWIPTIHNGYYYFNNEERYLYSDSNCKGTFKVAEVFEEIRFIINIILNIKQTRITKTILKSIPADSNTYTIINNLYDEMYVDIYGNGYDIDDIESFSIVTYSEITITYDADDINTPIYAASEKNIVVTKETPYLDFVDDKCEIYPKPQQFSPIILNDEVIGELKEVFFINDDGEITLENKETFIGDNKHTITLSEFDIDEDSIKVSINGEELKQKAYSITNNKLWFSDVIPKDYFIEVKYLINNSFIVDINYKDDKALIKSHTKGELTKTKISYECNINDNKIYAKNININPLYNHLSEGYVFVTDKPNKCDNISIEFNPNYVSSSNKEVVSIYVLCKDEYGNPVSGDSIKVKSLYGKILLENNIFDSNGVIIIKYIAPNTACNDTIEIECNDITISKEIKVIE